MGNVVLSKQFLTAEGAEIAQGSQLKISSKNQFHFLTEPRNAESRWGNLDGAKILLRAPAHMGQRI